MPRVDCYALCWKNYRVVSCTQDNNSYLQSDLTLSDEDFKAMQQKLNLEQGELVAENHRLREDFNRVALTGQGSGLEQALNIVNLQGLNLDN